MVKYESEQITPNSLVYVAKLITKNSTKVTTGIVRTRRRKDFNFDELDSFAEKAARFELDPPRVEVQSNYKGMHGGCVQSDSLRKSRRSRTSHAMRRAQIASRK